jgi:hypothetical protein
MQNQQHKILYQKRALCSLFVFLFGLIFSNNILHAQTEKEFKLFQDSLQPLSKIILDLRKSEQERISANTKFKTILQHSLEKEGVESFNFDSIPSIARLESDDKSFVIFNWELPHSDGTFTYYAYVLHKNKNTKTYLLTELIDASASIKRPETALLKANQWFGAHYYKIVTVKRKGKSYYCLLGADWNDKLSKKKLIEVLSFEKDGSLKFGAPIINYNKTILNRLILEYSSNVSMTLNYDEKSKRIIFDHLSPIEEGLKGQYQFYAPDLSYDALKFKKGKWQHIENIDARNNK